MRGLTIIVLTADPARFHGALSVAAAHAALERPTRLFLQADAVSLLRSPLSAPDDARFAKAGLPTLTQMFDEALALGVRMVVCQSGLILSGIEASALPMGVDVGGLIGALADADDQIAIA
jgi:predicted peroxiredoxin